MRPAAHVLFLTRQEKKAKEGDPTGRVPAAMLRGNLRCSIGRSRCRTRCAPLALRSNSCSESEHEARACCAARAHRPLCASRHVHRGAKPIRAIAALGPRFAAERSDGPSGCSLTLEAASAPRRRFAPARSAGVADVGSPFFGFFLWRVKERNCAAGRISRPPTPAKHTPRHSKETASKPYDHQRGQLPNRERNGSGIAHPATTTAIARAGSGAPVTAPSPAPPRCPNRSPTWRSSCSSCSG